MGKQTDTGYSASVRLWLLCGDQKIPLSHTAATYIIAQEAIDLPACNAHIVMSVDGTKYKRPVQLVNGMSKSNREAMVLGRDSVSPF